MFCCADRHIYTYVCAHASSLLASLLRMAYIYITTILKISPLFFSRKSCAHCTTRSKTQSTIILPLHAPHFVIDLFFQGKHRADTKPRARAPHTHHIHLQQHRAFFGMLTTAAIRHWRAPSHHPLSLTLSAHFIIPPICLGRAAAAAATATAARFRFHLFTLLRSVTLCSRSGRRLSAGVQLLLQQLLGGGRQASTLPQQRARRRLRSQQCSRACCMLLYVPAHTHAARASASRCRSSTQSGRRRPCVLRAALMVCAASSEVTVRGGVRAARARRRRAARSAANPLKQTVHVHPVMPLCSS